MALTFSRMAVDILYQRNRLKGLSMQAIAHAVADNCGVSYEQIMGGGRTALVAAARQEAMARIRRDTDYSFHEIARFFGRDHTTVIHAVKKMGGKLEKTSDGC